MIDIIRDEKIRKRAYEIWEHNGRQHGYDLDDWLEAETEFWIDEQQQENFYTPREE